MLTKVLELEVVPPYGLHVRFNNGQAGTHDCSKLALEPGPMIEPLRDPAFFARVFLEFGAPTWPNGFDMSPEWLRREMLAASELSANAVWDDFFGAPGVDLPPREQPTPQKRDAL